VRQDHQPQFRRGSEFVRFLIVGALGFIADGGVLLTLVHAGGMSRVWARIPSFLIAVTVTWWCHRRFTFRVAKETQPTFREWATFVIANGVGNASNLAIYWALIGLLDWPVLTSLMMASILAAGINYAMSARWVFRRS
jgi:putative flippase GtrA